MSDTPSTPKITPGSLVIFKRNGQQRAIGRVLRLFDKDTYRWGVGWNYKSDVKPHAEVLALMIVDTMSTCRSYESGSYTHDVPVEDLTPFDGAARKELLEDLNTKVNRFQQSLRLYETTVECDPKFMVPKRGVSDRLQVDQREEAKNLNTAEILTRLYGKCYPNPHLKCKVQ